MSAPHDRSHSPADEYEKASTGSKPDNEVPVLSKSITADESLGDVAQRKSDRKLLLKMDLYLLPVVSIIHLLSFLDRTNFGNAKVAGMTKDLGISKGYGYNIAACVFYITYAFFEVPSNLLLKKIGAKTWLPAQAIAWGLVTALMCKVNSYHGLLAARVFLGITEAGLFPGINYYLSLWYPRNVLSKRIAIFYASTTSSGAFSGVLAYGIVKLDGQRGLQGWQWIFCIEGVITIFAGIVAYFTMYDLPDKATFLTEPERKRVIERVKIASGDLPTGYSTQYVKDALTDVKTWHYALIYLGGTIGLYANSLFLPSIVSGLGYTDADAQLMTVPPYAVAMCVALAFGFASDYFKLRFPFIISSQLLAIIGYIVVRTAHRNSVRYGAMFLVVSGIYSATPNLLAWVSGNTGGDYKKGTVLAIVIGFGNLGGICSSFVYQDKQKPLYYEGHEVVIGVVSLSLVLSCLMFLYLRRENKKREEFIASQGLTEADRAEYREKGDRSPFFKYQL